MFLFQALRVSASQKPSELAAFLSSSRKPNFTPECKYQSFFMTLPDNEFQFPVFEEQLRIAEKILSASSISTVSIFMQGARQPAMEHFDGLEGVFGGTMHLLRIMKRLKISSGDFARKFWAQDAGETTGGANKRPEIVSGWTSKALSESHILTGVPWSTSDFSNSPFKVVEMPAVLQGGNFSKAVSKGGKKLAIIGSNDLLDTQQIYLEKYKYKLSENEAKEIYKKAFGADDVLVLGGKTRQPGDFFHIDLAVFFPREGTAVLIKVEPDGKNGQAVDALSKYKRQLISAGFEVIEIPTTQERIEKKMSYANAIPVRQYGRSNGRTTLILPSFKHKIDDGIEKKVREILMLHGFDVEFVKDYLHEFNGNIHCVTGALSFLDTVPKKTSNFA